MRGRAREEAHVTKWEGVWRSCGGDRVTAWLQTLPVSCGLEFLRRQVEPTIGSLLPAEEHVHLPLPASFSDANFPSDLFGVFLTLYLSPLNLKTIEKKPLSADCHVNGVWVLPEWTSRIGEGCSRLLHSFMLGFSSVRIMSPSWSTSETRDEKQPTVKCTFVLPNGIHWADKLPWGSNH